MQIGKVTAVTTGVATAAAAILTMSAGTANAAGTISTATVDDYSFTNSAVGFPPKLVYLTADFVFTGKVDCGRHTYRIKAKATGTGSESSDPLAAQNYTITGGSVRKGPLSSCEDGREITVDYIFKLKKKKALGPSAGVAVVKFTATLDATGAITSVEPAAE